VLGGRWRIDWPRTNRAVAVFGDAAPFDDCHAHAGYWDGMDVERTIDDIEQLQEMFEAPDIRPLSASASRLRIDGTTKPSRIARGFGCGRGMASVAEPSLQCFD
jgi:hypothetical protein